MIKPSSKSDWSLWIWGWPWTMLQCHPQHQTLALHARALELKCWSWTYCTNVKTNVNWFNATPTIPMPSAKASPPPVSMSMLSLDYSVCKTASKTNLLKAKHLSKWESEKKSGPVETGPTKPEATDLLSQSNSFDSVVANCLWLILQLVTIQQTPADVKLHTWASATRWTFCQWILEARTKLSPKQITL